MALSSRMLGWMVGIGGAVALVGGGALGVRLGEAASRPGVEEIRLADPAALPAASGIESRSPGGFSGFSGPPALEGSVLRTGIATDVRPGSFVLVADGARSTVEFTQPLRLHRISTATAPLVAGENVVVRLADGHAAAVLRTSQPAR